MDMPQCSVKADTLRSRTKTGWPGEQALTAPPVKTGRPARQRTASPTSLGKKMWQRLGVSCG
jgi:hypothetical protein